MKAFDVFALKLLHQHRTVASRIVRHVFGLYLCVAWPLGYERTASRGTVDVKHSDPYDPPPPLSPNLNVDGKRGPEDESNKQRMRSSTLANIEIRGPGPRLYGSEYFTPTVGHCVFVGKRQLCTAVHLWVGVRLQRLLGARSLRALL